MATFTQIVDRVLAVTSVNRSSGVSERSIVEGIVQDARRRVCMEAELPTMTGVVTTDGSVYPVVGTAPWTLSDIVAIDAIYSPEGFELEQVSPNEVRRMLGGSASVPLDPGVYAVKWPTIMLAPTPANGVPLTVDFVVDPGDLEASEEPTEIPRAFHYSTIGDLAIAITLEYDGAEDLAVHYDGKATAAVQRLKRWRNRRRGLTRPSWGGQVTRGVLAHPSVDPGPGW